MSSQSDTVTLDLYHTCILALDRICGDCGHRQKTGVCPHVDVPVTVMISKGERFCPLNFHADVSCAGSPYPDTPHTISRLAVLRQRFRIGANGILGWLLRRDQVDYMTREKRRSICRTCEYNKCGFCVTCKCYLRAKTSLKSQNCPRNKWDESGHCGCNKDG